MLKRLLIAVAVIIAIGLLLGILFLQGYRSFLREPAFPGPTPEVFVLAPGTSYVAMTQQVDPNMGLQQRWNWRVLAWMSGLGSQLRAGEYSLPPDITPNQLVQLLASGEVVHYQITVVEGWRYQQLRSALEEHPQLLNDIEGLSDAEVMTALGFEGQHPEGRFLPETYHFTANSSALELLGRMHVAMQSAMDEVWSKRQEGLPLETPDEALILASIIEKETGLASERGQIAGVFVRRLKINMRLQTDPTVIYGVGDAFDGDLTRRHLRTDTPYNTYTRHGLPPTPIALPGYQALLAAVNPEPGETLFFVARGDGSHQFSVTLEEHQEAVRRYQLGGK